MRKNLKTIRKENKKVNSLHEKAVRLCEGGIVEVDGLSVKLRLDKYIFDPCIVCEMDSLCHKGNDICDLCEECDSLIKEDCYLILMG